MYPIRILDLNFNILGEIDDYMSLIYTKKWYKPNTFELHINANKQNTEYLQRGNIIIIKNNVHKAGIIQHREVRMDENGKGGEEIVIKGSSLASILSRRITIPPEDQAYHIVTGNIETIMKEYVKKNCVIPDDDKRIIENLVIADDQNRGKYIKYQTRYKQLDDELEKLAMLSGLGWEIYLDLDNRSFIFDVATGRDLSYTQSDNPPVLFSIDFDNIKTQELIDSELEYKNIAYVAGQGEGTERVIKQVGEQNSGIERYEMFVDARDIADENILYERGEQKLVEASIVKSFNSEIMTKGTFKYEQDWDIGDIVTVYNDKWDEISNARVTEVHEVYESEKLTLNVTFGKAIPTLVDKIKQEIDMPIIESGTTSNGTPSMPDIIIYQEYFSTTTEQEIFHLTKGEYTPGTNSLSWYMYGLKQSNDALEELTPTSFRIKGGVPANTDILVEYIKIS